MFSIDRRSLQKFDWLLLLLTLLLVGIGFVNLFSATQAGTEGRLPSEFRRQLVALAVASIGLATALLVDYRRAERLAIPFYLATLLLCASTLVFAPEVRGSRAWLIFGPFSVQPAEFAKLGLVLALALLLGVDASAQPADTTILQMHMDGDVRDSSGNGLYAAWQGTAGYTTGVRHVHLVNKIDV